MKMTKRRQFLSLLGVGLGSVGLSAKQAQAHHTETHFGDTTKHKLVYQCNKAEPEYIEHLLFSCGEMMRKYGDDIHLVIAAFGAGLNLVATQPNRPISSVHKQRVKSLYEYGVVLQACGNTMKGLQWTEKDIIDEAEIIEIGVDGVMKLQEQGFSYIAL